MELKQLSENVFYIPNTSNIGAVRVKEGVVLIDSGLDDDTAKKVLRLLEEMGLRLLSVINTHSHADHFGGNFYLKQKTGLTVYASENESGFIRNGLLEPFYLFSGADPLKELKVKFLAGKPSPVDYIIDRNENKISLHGVEFQILELPGHSPGQIGIGIEDVLFCGDSVFSPEVLERHKLPFCMDPGAQYDTLDLLDTLEYRIYIPGHGDPVSEIKLYTDAYRKIIHNIEEHSLELLLTKMNTPDFLAGLCTGFGVSLKSAQQYYLMNSVAMAYLSHLCSKGQVQHFIEENILYWKRT